MMKYRKPFVFVCLILITLTQSSCAGSAPIPPTQTAIVDTSTPEDTATPTATFTPTVTPSPTATSTPAGTPTQIPEVTPPAEGTGNVVGLVLWNNEPVKKTAVWLCEDWAQEWNGSHCVGKKSATTDKNGYYVFKNIKPRTYIVSINSFSSKWFIYYINANRNERQAVVAGKTLILDPWNIWKFDIHLTSPTDEKLTPETQPVFKWEPYPDVAYYKIFIVDKKDNRIVNEKIQGTEFIPVVPLKACHYSWHLEAYNDQDIIISRSVGYWLNLQMNFEVIDAPETCK